MRSDCVPGTTPHRQRNLLDVMAGVPKPTVGKSLVPWLSDCLNPLAGLLPEVVMRFGHSGPVWTITAAPVADADDAGGLATRRPKTLIVDWSTWN